MTLKSGQWPHQWSWKRWLAWALLVVFGLLLLFDVSVVSWSTVYLYLEGREGICAVSLHSPWLSCEPTSLHQSIAWRVLWCVVGAILVVACFGER